MSWHFYWNSNNLLLDFLQHEETRHTTILPWMGHLPTPSPSYPVPNNNFFSVSGGLLTGVFNVIQVRHCALQSIFVSTKGSMPLNGLWNILLIFVSSINEQFLIFYSFFLVWTRLLLLWQYSPSRFQELWKVSSWCHNQEKSTSATQCKPIIKRSQILFSLLWNKSSLKIQRQLVGIGQSKTSFDYWCQLYLAQNNCCWVLEDGDQFKNSAELLALL